MDFARNLREFCVDFARNFILFLFEREHEEYKRFADCTVYAKVAQLVEYVSSNDRLFYLGGSSPTVNVYFFLLYFVLFSLILFHYCFIFIIFF